MNGLENLEEILEILTKQEDLLSLMEQLQEEKETVEGENADLRLQIGEMESGNRKLSEEISRFKMEIHSLREQLEESMQLNEQLLSQNGRLQKQIEELKNLNSR